MEGWNIVRNERPIVFKTINSFFVLNLDLYSSEVLQKASHCVCKWGNILAVYEGTFKALWQICYGVRGYGTPLKNLWRVSKLPANSPEGIDNFWKSHISVRGLPMPSEHLPEGIH
jgi:hypothetical protein